MIGCCGIVCDSCIHMKNGCAGCRAGGGDESCENRQCCEASELDGCWVCNGNHCDKGYFGDEVWMGLNLALCGLIKTMGAVDYEAYILDRLGKGFDYGRLRNIPAEEVKNHIENGLDVLED